MVESSEERPPEHAGRDRAVLIACSEGWDAPGRLPAVLARAGCRVDVLCPTSSALFHTRYVERKHEAPAELGELLRVFSQLRGQGDYDWIVAVDDSLLEALECGPPEELRHWFPVDPAREGFEILRGKTGFCKEAQRLGLSIPQSAIAHTLEEAGEAARRIGFPVVLKRDVSYGGMGVRLVESMDKLEATYARLEDSRPCVVQEMIQGPIGNTAALFVHGRPVTWMTAYKVRTWPGSFGPSSARRFVDRPEMAPVLARLGQHTGYHGFLALDWIERAPVAAGVPGELAFIELNARPVPAIQMAPLVGVDFAAAIPGLFGERVSVQVPLVTARIAAETFPMFPQDFFRAVTKRDQAQLEAWATGSHPFDDVPWDDPGLIAWHTRNRMVRRHFDRVFASRLPS